MIAPSSTSSAGAYTEAEASAARSESPSDVVRRYLECLNQGDFEGMLSLLDDGDVFVLPVQGIEAPRDAAVLLGYCSLMAANLTVTCHELEADGGQVRVAVSAQTRVHALLGLSEEKGELLFEVEGGIIRRETHLADGDVMASRLAHRKMAAVPFVEWASDRYPDEVDELVRPSGRLRVFDRSLLGARRRATRQIELLLQYRSAAEDEPVVSPDSSV